MAVDDQIQQLVDAPSERLNIEVKPWLDPSKEWGEEKIAKALLALRNQNGGFLVIGFKDDDMSPIPPPNDLDIRSTFHKDQIQWIVSRFASRSFSVDIHFPKRDEVEHPVIQVQTGIKTPIFCKQELTTQGTKVFSFGDIYVRTLSSNGIVSSSKIQKHEDLEDLLQRCFENREADHVSFLAKLMRSVSKADAAKFLSLISEIQEPSKSESGEEELKILNYGMARFNDEAETEDHEVELTNFAFLESALRIAGPLKRFALSREFLNFLHSANPSLTGWPIWLISQSFTETKTHPYPYEGTWEQFVQAVGIHYHLDFMIFSPEGWFYFARALEDDIQKPNSPDAPRTVDPLIQLARVAETLAVGKAFASILGENPEELKLSFAFRWAGLKDRRLSAWSNPGFDMFSTTPSRQNGAISFVELSATANEQEIIEKTAEAINPLTSAFGYELNMALIERLVSSLLQRKRWP